MKKFYLLAVLMMAISFSVKADYCTLTSTTSSASSGRGLTSVTLNETVVTVDQGTSGTRDAYYDLTATSVEVEAGSEVAVSASWTGEWMHGYLYIDYNSDEVFTPVLNSDNSAADNSELVSFTYYDPNDAGGGVNSLGESTLESSRLDAVPSFTIPADLAAGTYRARFNIDWCCIDPCGTSDIATNQGAIVDFTIEIIKVGRNVTVTASPEDGGVVTGATTQADGDVVITATANDGYTFTGWSVDGVIVSTDAEYTDSSDGDVDYVAMFVSDYCVTTATLYNGPARSLTGFTLSDGTNEGTITINQTTDEDEACYFDMLSETITLESGAEITPTVDYSGVWMCSYLWVDFNGDGIFTPSLNADGTPAADSELIAYSYYSGVDHTGAETSPGDGVGMANFTMPDYLPGTYRARFNIDYNTIDPCGTSMGSYFGGSMTDFYIQLTGDVTERTVTVTSANETMGTVSGGGSGSDAIYCKAIANSGYGFVNWTDASGEIISTDAAFSYSLISSVALTANFAPYYTISASTDGNGTVSPESTQVIEGESISITITPADNYKISTITLNGEDVTADLSGSVSSGGTITISDVASANTLYVTFEQLCLEGATATPFYETFNSSDAIDCWTIIDESGTSNTWGYYSSTVRYSGGRQVAASDWLITPLLSIGDNLKLVYDIYRGGNLTQTYSVYVITDLENPGDGDAIVSSSSVTSTSSSTQIVDLSAYAGQEAYIGFYVTTASSNQGNNSYLYLDNVGVMVPTYTMSATATGAGTVSINGSDAGTSVSVAVEEYTSTTFTAIPDDGYALIAWTDSEGNETIDLEYVVESTEAAMSMTASFGLAEARTITLLVNDAALGTVSFVSPESDETTLLTKEEYVTMTTDTIGTSSYFLNWTKDGELYSEDTEITYSGVEDITLVANYEARYTVTATASAGGTITLTYDGSTLISGVSVVPAGETANVMLNISDGRELGSLTIDGVDVTDLYNATTGYDVVVNAPVEVVAVFKYPEAQITYSVSGAGYIEISADYNTATDLVASGDYVTYGSPYYIYAVSYNGGVLQSLTVNGEASDYIDQITGYGNAEFYASGDQYIEAVFSGTSTGIEDAIADSASVYGTDGAIVITADGVATIYTLTGAAVKTVAVAGTTTVKVEQGVYIVSIDGASYKAIVK